MRRGQFAAQRVAGGQQHRVGAVPDHRGDPGQMMDAAAAAYVALTLDVPADITVSLPGWPMVPGTPL